MPATEFICGRCRISSCSSQDHETSRRYVVLLVLYNFYYYTVVQKTTPFLLLQLLCLLSPTFNSFWQICTARNLQQDNKRTCI